MPTLSQLQQEVLKGNKPDSIKRIDKGEQVDQWRAHIHFTDGNALYQDGTWKTSHGSGRKLTGEELEFIKKFEYIPCP